MDYSYPQGKTDSQIRFANSKLSISGYLEAVLKRSTAFADCFLKRNPSFQDLSKRLNAIILLGHQLKGDSARLSEGHNASFYQAQSLQTLIFMKLPVFSTASLTHKCGCYQGVTTLRIFFSIILTFQNISIFK